MRAFLLDLRWSNGVPVRGMSTAVACFRQGHQVDGHTLRFLEHTVQTRINGMFQRILVPLDGSERAEQAIPLAAHLAALGEVHYSLPVWLIPSAK